MPRGKYDRAKARLKREEKLPSETPIEGELIPPETLKYKLPRGICKCGHSGDGPLSDHADIDKGAGMGECGSIDCECKAFFFERYTDFFANKGLKTPAALEAINDTIKKLTAQAVSEGREKWADAGEVSGDGKGGSGGSVLEDTQREPFTRPNGAVAVSPAPETPDTADSGAVTGTQGEPAAGLEPSMPSPEHAAPPANKTIYSPRMNLLDEAIKVLTAKGYKITKPAERWPVYHLSFNPDNPERATMIVTLTTKERVIIDLYPETPLLESVGVSLDPYITISPIEDGISLKDAIRISRGIRKLAGVLKG